MTFPTVTSQQGASKLWVQTGPLTITPHSLNGADNNYEQISQVPPLTIPFPGVWEFFYNVRSSVFVPANKALWVHTALFKNGAPIPGSEALTGLHGANANQGIQSTAGQTFMDTFAANDVVTLHAYRIGRDGTATIISQPDGRTGVMAHWVSPV
ncbi:hypothetical protein ABZ897_45370 [Nonomuraea sp. NPDC046802]|uniref:hypothetical protein n=1 Tax=Nonomuraea sp. NPDC046802 TaxID=3154919 RepID=UPI003401013A